MSALTDTSGVSNEELEKQAATELFHKWASANDIDLTALSDDEYNQLGTSWLAAAQEELVAGTKEASEEEGQSLEEKIAGLTEDEQIELFMKQAEAEGMTQEELDAVPQDKLASAFADFNERILPHMAANNWEPVDMDAIETAQAKIAEAEFLGQTMAQSFMAELNKEAMDLNKANLPATTPKPKKRVFNMGGPSVPAKLKDAAGKMKGMSGKAKAGIAAAGLATAGLGAAAMKHRANKKKDQGEGAAKAASASYIDVLAAQRAQELIDQHEATDKTASALEEAVNERAIEILKAKGYTVE